MYSIDRKGLASMLLGLAIQAAMIALTTPHTFVARAVGAVACAFLLYGGVRTAQSRGYKSFVGFLALLSYLGVGILLLLTVPHGKGLVRFLAANDEARADA